MNKLETAYDDHLRRRAVAGEIMDFRFEPFGIRLAEHRCYYHPDFLVVYPDRFAVHEVKAYSKKLGRPRWEDDAIVKFKVAANMYPFWEFKIVYYNPSTKKWEFIEF